jgi:hypothetical protein
VVASFRIAATSDRFWNKNQFIDFVIQHQNQAIKLYLDPEAICLRTLGVYELLDMFHTDHVEIFTRNPLENHDRYKITLFHNQWLDQSPSVDTALHVWTKQKRFLALFGRPTAARLVLASYLAEKYSTLTHLHFSADTEPDGLLHFGLDKALEYDKTSIRRIGTLIDRLPILLEARDRYSSCAGYDFEDPLTNLYKDVLIDVVVESHVLGNSFFPTEKTLRPIWLKKPFLIFSNQDYLSYLRQMGFLTFNDYWDENYDGFETTNRITEMYRTMDHLANMDVTELESMYRDMQSILDHNYHLVQEQTFSRKINKIV